MTWPDFDFSKLPDVGDVVFGDKQVVMVNRERGEYWTTAYLTEGRRNQAVKNHHILPRTKPVT
jgi:hypothetical protein